MRQALGSQRQARQTQLPQAPQRAQVNEARVRHAGVGKRKCLEVGERTDRFHPEIVERRFLIPVYEIEAPQHGQVPQGSHPCVGCVHDAQMHLAGKGQSCELRHELNLDLVQRERFEALHASKRFQAGLCQIRPRDVKRKDAVEVR